MNFYRYWARERAAVHVGRRSWELGAYGGSNDSLAEAVRRAHEIAERAARAIERGQPPATYGYADRPLREEIIEEIHDAGQLAAVITRNSYGSLVLNTSRVMFVDIDYPSTGRWNGALAGAVRHLWNRLTGKPAPLQPDRDEVILSRVEDVTRQHPQLGVRVYRTAGGFRLLATSDTFDPTSAETGRMLADFGSDALYQRLCLAQQCFRARLSAKFWRCGAGKPPSRLPWASDDEEAEYRRWEQAYHARANEYATCALVATFGEPAVHDGVQVVLDTHDRLSCRDGAPLA
jgi:hypothetical protein